MEKSAKGEIVLSSPQGRKKIDKIDQRILTCLIQNSRMPLSRIGKIVKRSKVSVHQRVTRMIRDKVILDRILLLNPLMWGSKLHLTLISLDPLHEEAGLKALRGDERCIFLFRLSGRYNFLAGFCYATTESFHMGFGKLSRNLPMMGSTILPVIKYDHVPYDLFGVSIPKEKERNSHQVELTEIDAKILDEIRLEGDKRVSVVSRSTGGSYQQVRTRLTELHKSGVIVRFFTNVDIFSLGFQCYLIFIELRRCDLWKQMFDYLVEHKKSSGVMAFDNSISLMAIMVIRDVQELRDIMSNIQTRFPGSVKSYENTLVFDQVWADFFPKGVYEDVINKERRTYA